MKLHVCFVRQGSPRTQEIPHHCSFLVMWPKGKSGNQKPKLPWLPLPHNSLIIIHQLTRREVKCWATSTETSNFRFSYYRSHSAWSYQVPGFCVNRCSQVRRVWYHYMWQLVLLQQEFDNFYYIQKDIYVVHVHIWLCSSEIKWPYRLLHNILLSKSWYWKREMASAWLYIHTNSGWGHKETCEPTSRIHMYVTHSIVCHLATCIFTMTNKTKTYR